MCAQKIIEMPKSLADKLAEALQSLEERVIQDGDAKNQNKANNKNHQESLKESLYKQNSDRIKG